MGGGGRGRSDEFSRRDEERRWDGGFRSRFEDRRRDEERAAEDRRREDERKRIDERNRIEDRRRSEERRIDEMRRADLKRKEEELAAREMALVEAQRRVEDLSKGRDKWSHRSEMRAGVSELSVLVADAARSASVEANTLASKNHLQPRYTSSKASIEKERVSLVSSIPVLSSEKTKEGEEEQTQLRGDKSNDKNIVPAAPTPLQCGACGASHLMANCSEMKPWEFTPDYFGSDEFGQGFFFIPEEFSDARPQDELHQRFVKVIQWGC